MSRQGITVILVGCLLLSSEPRIISVTLDTLKLVFFRGSLSNLCCKMQAQPELVCLPGGGGGSGEPLLFRLREITPDESFFQLNHSPVVVPLQHQLQTADVEDVQNSESKEDSGPKPKLADGADPDHPRVAGCPLPGGHLFMQSLLTTGPALSVPLIRWEAEAPPAATVGDLMSPWTGMLKAAVPGIYCHEGFPSGKPMVGFVSVGVG